MGDVHLLGGASLPHHVLWNAESKVQSASLQLIAVRVGYDKVHEIILLFMLRSGIVPKARLNRCRNYLLPLIERSRTEKCPFTR